MHAHENNNTGNRFLISIGVTFIILIAEIAGGYWTGSLALLSDAAHVFMDVFALVLSYLALRLSALPPDDRHTYGFHRLEVMAALINGISLGAISIEIFTQSWQRWQNPHSVRSVEMLVIAVIGLVANLIVVFVLGQHDHAEDEHTGAPEREDLNVRSAFLHVVGDAISSVGVIVAAILIGFTGWVWIDPLMSVLIGLLILFSSWRVLKSALHILVEGVPEGISLTEVGAAITTSPGVNGVHDLHVWNLCSGHIALSAHVVLENQDLLESSSVMFELKRRLNETYRIEHTTIQFECAACGQGEGLVSHDCPPA
jgi:cobalt-zinc-cadmium efflux system protein